MSSGAKNNPVVAEHEAELARLRAEITFLKDRLNALKTANHRFHHEGKLRERDWESLQSTMNEVMLERDVAEAELAKLKKANLRLYDETAKWDAERNALQALVNEVLVERDILLVALREIATWGGTHPGNIARAAIAEIEGEKTLETSG